jgi:uncharacterized surface protein with fasciclin (FAS1) repeats
MNNFLKHTSGKLIIGLSLVVAIMSCNKELPDAQPITFPVATSSIGEYMASDTNFRLFRLASNKVGLFPTLSDRNRVFTVYAPSNTAFRTIGFDSAQIVNASGAALSTLGFIVNYHIIPGQLFKSTNIPTTFPNVQLPTNIALGNLPGTTVPFPLTAFLSRRTTGFWFNNVPGLPTTVDFTNGSLNQISRVATPPATMVKAIINSDANLSLFDSLIVRGDSGQVDPAKFDSIMKNPGANMTVFAPNNAAIKRFISQITGGLIPAAAPDAVHAAFIRTNVPPATARGVVAYHLLATKNTVGSFVPHRVFSVNFEPTPGFYQTLVNASVAAHPGVSVTSFFTGQVVDSMKVIGVGAGSELATAKPPTTFDRHGVNGVVHVIDRVLRPQ